MRYSFPDAVFGTGLEEELHNRSNMIGSSGHVNFTHHTFFLLGVKSEEGSHLLDVLGSGIRELVIFFTSTAYLAIEF